MLGNDERRTKWTFLGQDPSLLQALWSNIISWLVSNIYPSQLHRLLPYCPQEALPSEVVEMTNRFAPTKCISIGRPGGLEQLRQVTLKQDIVTKGYNVVNGSPFLHIQDLPNNCVLVENHAFSVNYADCCIRWGLYESAKQFVGWPIVPGFDIAGVISDKFVSEIWKPGDRVMGCSLFGAYSSRIAIPSQQLRRIPDSMSMLEAASLPAVSLTALYALHLAGQYPSATTTRRKNQAILIHSAAGGVGSMAIQMAKQLGLHPIVGVVGSTHKVDTALQLGCHQVIDKSQTNDMWVEARRFAPNLYSTILDPNGVSTLQDSYNHLCPTGRLIIFGFHSNLPLGRDMLSPFQWLQMGIKMSRMPKFDPMDLVVSNKSILGFNLSFFADEVDLVGTLFDQILDWWELGVLKCPQIMEMSMDDIGKAHEWIMSDPVMKCSLALTLLVIIQTNALNILTDSQRNIASFLQNRRSLLQTMSATVAAVSVANTPSVALAEQDEIPWTAFNGLIFNYRGSGFNGLDASTLNEPSVPFREFGSRLQRGEVAYVEFYAPDGDVAYVTFRNAADGTKTEPPIRIGEGFPIEQHDGYSSPAFVVRALKNYNVPYKFVVPGLDAFK